MYQALYRKWRARTFSDMAGQQAVIRTLRNQVISGRVSHAYLFCGSRGTGKTSAAKIMARAINCHKPVNGDPCLSCDSCRALEGEASLDVFEMDAASNSRVEEIRDLLEKVDYPPQMSRYKVYVIDEVHMLSSAAFNALLKTLEEPPPYMVFILATTEPQKLPATILSRCQRFDFGRLTSEQMIGRMTAVMPELAKAGEGALRLIARAAEGSMRDAWSLLDMCLGAGEGLTEDVVRQALGTADSAFLFEFMDLLIAGDCAGALEAVARLMRGGRDPLVFLRDLSLHARQVAAFKLGAGEALDIAGASAERFAAQGEGVSVGRLLRVLELSMRAEADARFASSPRGVLELFALRACRATDEKTAEALLERVEEVESALARLLREGAPVPSPDIAAKPARKSAKAGRAQAQDDDTASPDKAAPDAPAPGGKLPKDIWNGALKRLAREGPAVFAILNEGRFDGYRQGRYRLRFPREAAISRDFVMADERRALIERLLTEEGGAPAAFDAVVESAGEGATKDDRQREEDLLIQTLGRAKVQLDD